MLGGVGTAKVKLGLALLLVLGMVFAPLSVAAVWVKNQVIDTDAYVASVVRHLPEFERLRAQDGDHLIERVGEELRGQMAFLDPVEHQVAAGGLGEAELDPRIEAGDEIF